MEQPPPTTDETVIRGVVDRVTFRNPTNGYSVLQLRVPDQIRSITVVGPLLNARVGAHLLVRGTFQDHPKFGRQLAASAITETTPDNADGIEKYLASGLIKGIGPKTAARIVEHFGNETMEVLLRNPERVAELPGIGKAKAQTIVAALESQRETRDIMQFLLAHDISPNLAQRIYTQYKGAAVEILKRDPYLLARDMRGIGFRTADSIALKIGLRPDSPQRLKAGLFFALELASDDGHSFLPRRQLLERAQQLLELVDPVDMDQQIQELSQESFIVNDDENIYIKHLHTAEQFVASFIQERISTPESPTPIPETLRLDALSQAEASFGIQFSHEQREAARIASEQRLMIVTGGPGCGKTTVVRAFCAIFQAAGKRLLMAAPTGRAAQRMAQVTGVQATTIHRLLKYDPMSHQFLYGVNQPLPADVVIIDEASMIDILLAKDLFSAIPTEATVILVGDKDQLPSVGPGRVFAELIAVKEIATIPLSRLFRRGEESSITSIAHLVNSGTVPDVPTPDGVTKADAYCIPRSEPSEALTTIEKLVSDQLPKKFGFELNEITVLTPSNRGPLGTIALNERLQSVLNPVERVGEDQQIAVGQGVLRLGDRVCQRVNNYQIDQVGVYNGDIGSIYAVDASSRSVTVELWDGRLIRYSDRELHELSLAYAMTVHRSQGSEIPCVVLALHDSHFTLLDRQLIYTAITRAKKLLVIVGSKRALTMATKRFAGARRLSNLHARIVAGFQPQSHRALEE
jgi:exodeoxyribonuclease V alpha subunit